MSGPDDPMRVRCSCLEVAESLTADDAERHAHDVLAAVALVREQRNDLRARLLGVLATRAPRCCGLHDDCHAADASRSRCSGVTPLARRTR